MTRNNSDNDLNHDLGRDFVLGSLALNIKRTIKNKYLEACKMEKQKSLELEKNGVYPELEKFTSLVLSAEHDLHEQFSDEEGTIVRMAFDAETFDSLEWVIQYCYLSTGTNYKRLISKHGATKFTRNYPMPGVGGSKC